MGDWRVVRGTAPERARAFLAACRRRNPEDVVHTAEWRGAQVLRRGHTRVVVALPGLGILKLQRRFHWREGFWWVRALGPLVHEFDMALAAAAHGLPAPRAVFAAERRTCGVLRRAALLTDQIGDAVTLREVLEGNCPPPGRPRTPRGDLSQLCSTLGSLVARLHEAGGLHGDLVPGNVLVSNGSAALTLVDWSSAFFLDGDPSSSDVLPLAAIAHHYTPVHYEEALGLLTQARAAWAEHGTRSGAFQRLCRRDLLRLVMRLASAGAPASALHALLHRYFAARYGGHPEWRALVEEFATACREKLRKHIERALARAGQRSRAIEVLRHRGQIVCHRSDVDRPRVLDALMGHGPSSWELRECAEARRVWCVAHALARTALPVRRHLAARFGRRSGAGTLLVESPSAAFERVDLGAAHALDAFARFVRLLHAFGFRFQSCVDGAVAMQAGQLGPFSSRQGSGFVLDDPGAVCLLPGTSMRPSTRIVSAWVARRWGDETAAAVQRACARPIRHGI